jgi:hypothetical protein
LFPGSPILFAVLAGAVLAGTAAADVAAPPPPATYRAVIRYSIRAGRNERVAQFLGMLQYFESLGFQKDPGPDNEPEDARLTRMTGTISSANAARLLREPHVRAILLLPPGFEVPADAAAPVKVRIDLDLVLTPERQALLAAQVQDRLGELGFRPMVGFDNRGHTRLMGTIPAGHLDELLEDLRLQGSGWLAPRIPRADLPGPLSSYWPVRLIEVVPEPTGVPAVRQAPAAESISAQDPLARLTPELRALTANEEQAAKPTRMQVILAMCPSPDDRGWQRELRGAAPGLVVEGRLGPVVTVLATPSQMPAVAGLPFVSTVRLPQAALQERVAGETPKDDRQVLRESGLDGLHKLRDRGRGVRVAIVGSDFRGLAQFLGKQLPADTRYVDVTAERSPDVQPDPFPGEPAAVGHGTRCALAAALAAPEASFTLVRIDPAAPYQLLAVARYIDGAPVRSEGLDERSDQFIADSENLRIRHDELLRERRELLDNFKQDEATVKRREAHFQKEAAQEREEVALLARQARYVKLVRDLQGLKGIRIVANTLVWNEGYPMDGSGALSRYLDDCPRTAFWFQAAGDTRGQTWGGRFLDVQNDGVMEFTSPETSLPPGRWTRELNFFAWQPVEGQRLSNLPAKATVRVSIQWREPHDPEFLRRGEDLYRVPLANLRLVVLRQRDPKGEKLPADDLEVIARSAGLPQRLVNEPGSAIYEQTLEFTVETPGPYALRVEGRIPPSIRPVGVPSLPILERTWELWPRIFVNVLDEASRAAGRAVFADYTSDLGGIGMPAEAQAVLTTGAADPQGQARPYSARGTGQGMQLLRKPNLLAHDGLSLGGAGPAFGTGPAASFAAGSAAAALSAGMSPAQYWQLVQSEPGKTLRLAPGSQTSSK